MAPAGGADCLQASPGAPAGSVLHTIPRQQEESSWPWPAADSLPVTSRRSRISIPSLCLSPPALTAPFPTILIAPSGATGHGNPPAGLSDPNSTPHTWVLEKRAFCPVFTLLSGDPVFHGPLGHSGASSRRVGYAEGLREWAGAGRAVEGSVPGCCVCVGVAAPRPGDLRPGVQVDYSHCPEAGPLFPNKLGNRVGYRLPEKSRMSVHSGPSPHLSGCGCTVILRSHTVYFGDWWPPQNTCMWEPDLQG